MFTVQPHPYQDEAIDRAVERGSLLIAYEMGLGKTFVSIAVVEELLGEDEIDCAVIVCGASLKYQWAQAIAQATDVEKTTKRIKGSDGAWRHIEIPTDDYCIVIDGPPEKRAAQFAKVKETRPDYVIFGYSNVVDDWSHVRRIKPGCIILDEATAIKSFRAKRTRKIKRFTAPYRFALSGTAVENVPEELFSIMQWVDPDVLGRYDIFDKAYIKRNHYGGVERYKNLPTLHKKMAPAMVRKTRLDPDVAPYLPDVDMQPVYVPFDPAGRKLYNYVAKDLLKELKANVVRDSFDLHAHYHGGGEDEDHSAQGRIMARYNALSMLCCHPDLLVLSAQDYADSEKQRKKGVKKAVWPGSKYAWQLWKAGLLDNVVKAPKLDQVVADITEILDGNPDAKIILFSFYKDMLEIIQDALPQYGSVQFHGELSAAERAAAKVSFQTGTDCRLFLSSDAGRYGVDLPEANYLFNYDLPWSAGAFAQGNGRHVRAGSKHDLVYVRSYLIRGSTEVRQYAVVGFKGQIGSAILDGKGADRFGRLENSIDSLTTWLEERSV